MSAINCQKKHHQNKIKKMAQRYRKFKTKHPHINSSQQRSSLADTILQKCKVLWCKVVPSSIRGYQSQYEQFTCHWKSQIGKQCLNQLISNLPYEQNLKNYEIGSPIVLGLLYSTISIKKIIQFITQIRNRTIQKTFVFCPINIDGRKYQQQIQSKIGYFDESVIILWRGLFNQIIILNRIKIYEIDMIKTVHEEIKDRIAYEELIKQHSLPESINETHFKIPST